MFACALQNYLNDSYYMLYHHDIPTSHPHPAFSWGDLSRLAQVSHKMRRNDPVTVTFVGGSVSSSYCQNPSVTCWVAPVSDWLREQNPQVQIINNAVGGTTSRTTAECFDAMVGKDADLIFLEYSYNDRRAFMQALIIAYAMSAASVFSEVAHASAAGFILKSHASLLCFYHMLNVLCWHGETPCRCVCHCCKTRAVNTVLCA